MTRATQKEQATTTHDFEKKFIDIFRTFHQRKLRLSFLDWEPKCGDNINHKVLWSATGLESPKSLASNRASFLDSFSPIGQVTFTSPSLCASILVFFPIFKLTVFSMLNENFFVTCKVRKWRKLEIFAVSVSSSWSLLSLNACTQKYLRAKGVQARTQVGCHWILSFAFILLAHSSSPSIRRNRVFYMILLVV